MDVNDVKPLMEIVHQIRKFLSKIYYVAVSPRRLELLEVLFDLDPPVVFFDLFLLSDHLLRIQRFLVYQIHLFVVLEMLAQLYQLLRRIGRISYI